MGIFDYNNELAAIKEDVRTLKQQVQELLKVLSSPNDIKDEKPHMAVKPEPSETEVKPDDKEDKPTENEPAHLLKEELQKLTDKIETAVYQEGIIHDLHQELQQLKKGLIDDISRGYAMDIINIYERLADTNAHFGTAKGDTENLKRLLENNILYITDLLEDEYSIEMFTPEVGTPYNPKEQKAMRTIDTDDATKANTVAECISVGFRNDTTGRILRQARIVVYKLNINH